MRKVKTVNGHVLKFEEPTGDLGAFVERLEAMAADESVTEDSFLLALYGSDNPLLDHEMAPGHSMATRETLAHPVWPYMGHLQTLKRTQLGLFDAEAAAARHTMTLEEAAAQLGLHVSAVRQLVQRRRLPAWKKSGKWHLAPGPVSAYEVHEAKRHRRTEAA